MVVACAASGGGLTVLVPAQGCCGNRYVCSWSFWPGVWRLAIKLLGRIEGRSGSMFTYSRVPAFVGWWIAIGDVRSVILATGITAQLLIY